MCRHLCLKTTPPLISLLVNSKTLPPNNPAPTRMDPETYYDEPTQDYPRQSYQLSLNSPLYTGDTTYATPFRHTTRPSTLGLVYPDDKPLPGIPDFSANPELFTNAHSQPRQLTNYEYATGWVPNLTGGWEYVEPGTIEEVGDDNDNDQQADFEFTSNTSHTDYDSQGYVTITKALPEDTPPPPRPAPNAAHLVLLPAVIPSSGSVPMSPLNFFSPAIGHPQESIMEEQDSTYVEDTRFYSEIPHQHPSPSLPQRPTSAVRMPSPNHSSRVGYLPSRPRSPLDDSNESHLLEGNLALIERVFIDANKMRASFAAHNVQFDLRPHINMCTRIMTALTVVRHALNRRSHIGQDEWQSRGVSWHQKYGDRLFSLHKSLMRLRGICDFPLLPRIDRLDIILNKLEEHERKLLNLASKFENSFKRLKVRHIYSQLADAHVEAYQMRIVRTRSARATLEEEQARRNGEKVRRDELRRSLQEHRAGTGRRPSLTS